MRLLAAVTLLFAIPMSSCRSAVCASDLFSADGVCLEEPPDCGCRAGEVCGPEAVTCVCAPGYSGNPCQWVGVVNDELFEEGDVYWVGSKGATTDPTTDGPNGGGQGSLEPSVVCNAGALRQRVLMPPYAAAGPLAGVISYRAEDVERIAVGFNGAWTHLPTEADEWVPARFCLGEAAYGELPSGGLVDVEIAPSEKGSPCFATPQRGKIEIDLFTIEPATAEDACPAPGSVLNGEAKMSEGGWRFIRGGLAQAGLAAGAGSDGLGDGVRLHRPVSTVDLAAATTKISVPASGDSPALRFWWNGTAEHVFQVEIGAFEGFGARWRSVDRLRGNGGGRPAIYCLPPWTHGTVLDLTLALVDEAPGEPTTLKIDDVEIVEDPDCSDSKELLDPGFESAPNSWFGSYIDGPQTDLVRLRRDSEGVRARNGTGVLEMKYETDATDLRMEAFILVPESPEEQCSELVFHSDVPAVPEANVEWVLGRAEDGERGTLRLGGGWKENRISLPVEWVGRWVRFQVRVRGLEGLGATIPVKQIFLDDFVIDAPVPCPATEP